jgi:hypothetical protein
VIATDDVAKQRSVMMLKPRWAPDVTDVQSECQFPSAIQPVTLVLRAE